MSAGGNSTRGTLPTGGASELLARKSGNPGINTILPDNTRVRGNAQAAPCACVGKQFPQKAHTRKRRLRRSRPPPRPPFARHPPPLMPALSCTVSPAPQSTSASNSQFRKNLVCGMALKEGLQQQQQRWRKVAAGERRRSSRRAGEMTAPAAERRASGENCTAIYTESSSRAGVGTDHSSKNKGILSITGRSLPADLQTVGIPSQFQLRGLDRVACVIKSIPLLSSLSVACESE